MNGARSTFMRKGYWLTSFAAAVLLAASPGMAAAQEVEIESVEIAAADSDNKVGEHVSTNVVITLDQALPDAKDGGGGDTSVIVTVTIVDADGAPDQAEATDLRLNNGDAGTGTFDAGDRVVMIPLETLGDLDAVDEAFTVRASLGTVSNGTRPDDDDADDVSSNTEDVDEDFTIDDDETQNYVFDLRGTASNVLESGPFTVDLYADPARPVGESVNIYVRLDGAKATVAPVNPPTGHPITNAAGTEGVPVALEITPSTPDENRTDDTITLTGSMFTASTGQSADIPGATLELTILDVHQLPAAAAITAETMDKKTGGEKVDPMVTEGEEIFLFVTIENPTDDRVSDTEMFRVTPEVDAAHGLDVKVTPSYMMVSGSGDVTTDAFTVTAVTDEDVGDETLMLNLVLTGDEDNGPGSSTGMFSIAIKDGTTPKIETQDEADAYPKIQKALGEDPTNTVMNPGQTGMIMTSDLFMVIDGYNASYGVSVEGDSVSASASGETITINAISATVEGMPAKVTVTGTARTASSSFAPSQTVSNVAELTFPVTVVDTELVVMLTADPMEVEAGGTSTLTATANRYVTTGDGDVEINLVVVGDGTVDPASITIAIGAMSGSAMLTANEKVTVVASGSGISGLMQVEVTVTAAPEPEPEPDVPEPDVPEPDVPEPDVPEPDVPEPDAPEPDVPEPDVPEPDVPEPVPTPALPLIAQWLLGLGLMGGGARQLFRRRRQG